MDGLSLPLFVASLIGGLTCGLVDPSGCGKSTVINDFVAPLLGGIALRPNGSSTEAGIRQNLNGDVVPVVIDEGRRF